MPWVRFDDQFTIHRKVDGLSDTAFRLHVAAIFWCARNLTDGFVPKGDLAIVSARVRAPARFAAECVVRNIWHLADEECASPKCPAHREAPAEAGTEAGWFIHDYFEYQPRREKVLRERKMKADAGRIGGIASGQSRRSATKRSKPKAKPKQRGSVLVEHPYPYQEKTPQPPAAGAAGGHAGQHPNCRACGTNPRGKPPEPQPTPTPPPVADVLAVNGVPLRGAPVEAIAAQVRQAITRQETAPEGPSP